MFTHLLPVRDDGFKVEFSKYAERHYLKKFKKRYKATQWDETQKLIISYLERIGTLGGKLQKTQQVDELWHKGDYWIFKYDFRIMQTNQSTKASGNRCIAFLDNANGTIEILIIYSKTDLPKSPKEQSFIEYTVRDEFPDYYALVR